jgi:TonB family protein
MSLTLGLMAGCAVARAQAPVANSPAYDAPPALIESGTAAPVHCEIVQFDPKDAGHAQSIIVAAIVGRQGLPMNAHVARGAGMGFDEKAIMAVRQLRFRPAEKDGAAVAVPVYVRVTFDNMPAPAQ